MKIIQRTSFLLVCSFMVLSATSQNWLGGMVSTDSLTAGEVNVFQMNSGYHQLENTWARLVTYDHNEDMDRCPECFLDTIWASNVQTFNDTAVTLTFDIPASAYPTTWYLSLENGLGGYKEYYPMRMFNRIFIHTQPKDHTSCLGGTATFDIFAYDSLPINYTWFHKGRSVQREHSPTLNINSIEYSDSGMYYCMLEVWPNDTTWSDTAYLHIKDFPKIQTIPEGPTSIGPSEYQAYYGIKRHEEISEYDWKLIPGNAGIIEQEGMDDTLVSVIWDEGFGGIAGIFVETTMGGCPGLNSDTLWIDVAGLPDAHEICIVGIDEETEKCRIVWNKSDDLSTASYNIYRESNEADVFLKLASVSGEEVMLYVDATSVPNIYPHSYKMSLTDTSGNESELGSKHTTILLSSTLGTGGQHFLDWNHYVGYPFLSYEIYHGNEKDSMILLSTISSNVNSFAVHDPLPGTIYYQIVARRSDGCSPALKSDIDYSETRSNIDQLYVYTGSNKYNPPRLDLSPNPAINEVRINYNGTWKGGLEITILNLLGQVCGQYLLENNQTEIDISGFEPGMYLLHIEEPEGILIQKLVIRR